MSYPTCSHPKDDGVLCGSRALPDGKYCYVHSRQVISAIFEARARHQSAGRCVLPPLADFRTIQGLLSQLVQALGNYAIDLPSAKAMLYALRLASKELNNSPKCQNRRQRPPMQPVTNQYFTCKFLKATILRENSPYPHENEEF